MTPPIPPCCKAANWRVAGAAQEVKRIAAQLSRTWTPAGMDKLEAAKAVLADNRRWAEQHAATHAGGDDAA